VRCKYDRRPAAALKHGGKSLSPRTLLIILAGALLIAASIPAFSLTCDECREIEKKREAARQELAQKEKEISAAFEKKQFQKVGKIRSEITAMRRSVLDMRAQDEECKKACRPDVVKELECQRLESELLKLDTEDSQTDTDKIDALYRELSRCTRELEQLKKPEK